MILHFQLIDDFIHTICYVSITKSNFFFYVLSWLFLILRKNSIFA